MKGVVDPCPACGTWMCKRCGWQRPKANRFTAYAQECGRCAHTEGVMLPTTHRDRRIREAHDEYARSWED